ncbi:MAG: acetoacetate--CoA ligase [Rhodospirillales bacterium]|nr:acetoacetate--CoA ligase [Rhodospirillales bacterium]
MSEPLWRPSPQRIAESSVTRFMEEAENDWGVTLDSFEDLYGWSVAEKEKFWQSLRDYAGLTAESWGDAVLVDGDKMPGARWFPGAKFNFAQNLLRRRDDTDAIVFWGEDKVKRRMSRAELYDQVSVMAQALRAAGIKPGDRIAAMVPNMPETVAAMLAATSIGAIWSSCSPDFGVQGVLDRFGQIEPRILFAAEGYHYNGKSHDVLGKLREITAQLPSLEHTVIIPYTRMKPDLSGLPGAVLWGDFTTVFTPGEIEYEMVAFDHPIYILYSSGTTGVPKCIVHGGGGALFQHVKEHQLHGDIRPGDRVFYFTTCGWMMWNWLVTALASEATLILYDGSPFHPGPEILFDYADAEKITFFGTSAKFIDAVKKAGLEPAATHDLSSVRAIASTGSPLVPESFDYVYDKVKKDVHLASVSGGTDLLACFVGSNPIGPVWRGEIQTRGLAMDVHVFDDEGKDLPTGEKGELVCTTPFPSMPVGFWNDPDGSKYHDAYYDVFPNVWRHGDWVALTEHGGMIIYGRSDATLNPGGVRIGTAEIYRQVEKLEEVVESIVVGQTWDNDTRVVLFTVLRPGMTLDDALIAKIRKQIKDNCSPRHIPAKVIQVADIPRTKSGKITELAVRDVIEGRPVKNKEALANAEALDLYKDLPQLRD